MAAERTIKVRFTGDAKGLAGAARDGEKALGKWQSGLAKVAKAGTVMLAAAGAAAGLALAAGVASGLNKSKVDALLAAQLGATGDTAKKLGAVSGELYASGVADSVESAGAAIRAAVQNGLAGAGDAALQAVAGRVATLATVMQEDTAKVASAVSTMLKTGMAQSAEEAFDLLQRGTELGINKQQDLLDTFTEYPTLFRQLGLDGPKAMGLLGQAIQAGARDSDKAADALKEFSIRAVDGSKLSAQSFKALGLNAGKMASDIAAGGPRAAAALDLTLDRMRAVKDPVTQAQIAVGLFGTQAEDLGQALFAMDPSGAVGSLGQVSGAAGAAGDALGDSLGGKADALKRRLEMGLVVQLDKAAGWIERNQTLVKTLALVLGPIAGIIIAITVAMKIWAVVQAVLNLALFSSPIGLIVLAIVALVAVIVLIATKTTFFQTVWNTVWGAVKATAAAVWDWLKSAFRSGTEFITSRVAAIFEFVKSLPGKLLSLRDTIQNALTAPFRAAFNKIADLWNGTVGKLRFTAPDWLPGIGGKGFSMPTLPRLATGGPAAAGRSFLVGERGPEVLTMGGRSGHVTSNADAFGTTVIENHIHIGDEVVRVIRTEMNSRDRSLRRRALAGAGVR